MSGEPGVFQAFYASPAQHPLLLWGAAAVAVGSVLARPGLHPSLRAYGLLLGALSALDAWLTSAPVPGLGELPDAVGPGLALVFVLLGDLRYLLVVTCGAPDGTLVLRPRGVAAAAGLTAVVPLLSQLVSTALPDAASGARVLFLVYELLFLALAALLAARHPRARAAPWIRALSRFVMLYYALWAAADVAILAGLDAGFALRVVPNVLYYGGFVAALAWLAPAEPRA